MEEDGEHGGSQIAFPGLKELSDRGRESLLSHRPTGSRLPMGQNV